MVVYELRLHRSVDDQNGTSFYYPGDTFTEDGLKELFYTEEEIAYAKRLGVVVPKYVKD